MCSDVNKVRSAKAKASTLQAKAAAFKSKASASKATDYKAKAKAKHVWFYAIFNTCDFNYIFMHFCIVVFAL